MDEIKTIDIARKIKEIRIKNQLSQAEMADRLGYSERQIRRIEANGTYDIGIINLISKEFNVSTMGILYNRMPLFVKRLSLTNL